MTSKIKWWLNGIGATLLVVVAVVYLIARPIIVQNLDPVLKETAEDKINGTLTWETMDLDPQYNLSFDKISLTDAEGKDVLTSSNITVNWSFCGLWNYFINHGTVFDIVRHVEIIEPHIYIQEKADSSWNVQNLLKPQEEETPGTFQGTVALRQGIVQVGLMDGNQYEMSGVQSDCRFTEDKKIKGTMKASFLDAPVDVEFTYADENHFDGTIKTGAMALKGLKPIFDRFTDFMQSFDIKDGTAEISQGRIWKSDGLLSYQVKGSFSQVAGKYEKYALTEGAAFFDIKNGIFQIHDISGKINGESFNAQLTVNTQEDKPNYQGEISCHQVQLGNIFTDESIRGILTGNVSFVGKENDIKASGNVSLSDGVYRDYRLDQGNCFFSYVHDVLSIEQFQGQLNGATISGHGTYEKNTGSFDVIGKASEVSLDSFSLGVNVSGVVSGDFHVTGRYHTALYIDQIAFDGRGDNLFYDGQSATSVVGKVYYNDGAWNAIFTGDGISLQGNYFSHLSGQIAGKGNRYTMSHLSAAMGSGNITVEGVYDPNYMNLHIKGVQVDMNSFSSLAGMSLSGVADFDMTVQGTVTRPLLAGHIHAENGCIGNAAFDQISGKFTHRNGTILLESVDWIKGDGSHQMTGEIKIADVPELNIQVKTKKYRIEDIVMAMGKDYPVTGYIDNSVHLTGTTKDLKAEGNFMAYEGSIAKKLYQNISGKYVYDNNKFSIHHGLVYAGDGVLRLDGDIDKTGVNIDVAAYGIDAEGLLPEVDIHGKLMAYGHVKGSFASPSFDGAVKSRGIRYKEVALQDISAGVMYENGVVLINDGHFSHGSGQFNCKGNYDIGTARMNGTLRFKNWDVKDIIRLYGISVSRVSGLVDGQMLVRGTSTNPEIIFRATLGDGYLGNEILKDGIVDISYLQHILAINKLYIPVGDGILAAQGGVDKNGNYDIQVAANHFNLRWIPLVLGIEGKTIDGDVTAAVNIKGQKDNPLVDFSVGVNKPGYNDYYFDSFSLMGNIENNIVHMAQVLVKKDIYKISAKGDIPYHAFVGKHISGEVPLNFEVNLDQADLDGLAVFFSPISSAKGPIQGKLKFTGAWDNPEIHGRVFIKDGEVSIKTLDDVLKPVQMEMNFNGYHADMKGQIIFGAGKALWDGYTDWENEDNRIYYGTLHISSPSIHSTYYKGPIEGDFHFGEDAANRGITGQLSIYDATGDIPFALFSGKSGDLPEIPVNVDILIGDKVQLYNSALYDIGLKGNITIAGTLANPYVTGRVNVDRGTVKLNTTEFKINEGYATWAGHTNGILPKIYTKATSHIGQYTITAQIEGIPGEMKTTFHSEPFLKDSQILMLLALHANPEDENKVSLERALLNAGLTMVIGSSVQNFLKDTIGLDLISITSGLNDKYDNLSATGHEYYYIKIGKYVFRDLMVTATTGVNNEERSFGLHYDLNSHIGISAWYNNKNEKYIGTDWKFKF